MYFIRPYIMDLGSTNGTFINVRLYGLSVSFLYGLKSSSNISLRFTDCIFFFRVSFWLSLLCMQDNRIEPQRYYELFEKDTIRFGNSRYEINGHADYACLVYFLFISNYFWPFSFFFVGVTCGHSQNSLSMLHRF